MRGQSLLQVVPICSVQISEVGPISVVLKGTSGTQLDCPKQTPADILKEKSQQQAQQNLERMKAENAQKDAFKLADLRAKNADLLQPKQKAPETVQQQHQRNVEEANEARARYQSQQQKEQSATDRYGAYVAEVMSRRPETNNQQKAA